MSWDTVDTVIRPASGANGHSGKNGFSGNLEPATNPVGHMIAPPPPPSQLGRGTLKKSEPQLVPASLLAPVPQVHGKVIVVFGCRGGAGATMLAVNTAAALARAGKQVCLLDLDLQLGDVFVAMDMEASTSISALAREAGQGRLDAASLRRRLQRHDSGVYALSQTGRLDDVDPELPERLPMLLSALCEHFDYLVVDGVRDFDDHALAAIDAADRVALVVTQDVQAVRRASRVVQLFRRLNYAEKKLAVVVNRQSSKASVAEQEIERVLGLPIAAAVRNDYARLRASLDEGALLHDVARGSGVARDVEYVAKCLTSDARPARPEMTLPVEKQSPGLFARIFKRGN